MVMGLLDSITTYFSPATQPVQPVSEELTAGKWMIDNGKTPEQVLADPFLIQRVARQLLADKGIKSPTEHQLHETRFGLATALKNDTWYTFTSPAELELINVELGSECCAGNVFYEREAYGPQELAPESLQLSKRNTFRMEQNYSNGCKGQVIAATFISGRNRTSSDFSHVYGDEPWNCHLRAWNMLENIPKGTLLENFDVDLITETNRLIHAADPRQVSQFYRAMGALTRGRVDVAGRIREGRTVTQMYTFKDEEVEELKKLGIGFHALPGFASGTQKGSMEYPAPETIVSSMEELVVNLKQELQAEDADVVGAAAKFCRELVALHPYEDSNGRMARILMNRILMEYGYAPAILSHADSDLTMGEAAWKQEVQEGVAHTRRYLDKATLYSVDSLLGKEKIVVHAVTDNTKVDVGGMPFTTGTDGFLYDVTGRPHLMNGETLEPLSQLEYYFLSRRLIVMPRHKAIDALKQLTAVNKAVTDSAKEGADISNLKLGDDLSAREADSRYAIRGDAAVLSKVVELATVEKAAMGDLFRVHHQKGTATSSLLSKYSQLDLEYWYLEDALKKAGEKDLEKAIHGQRENLFAAAKDKLDGFKNPESITEENPEGFSLAYEKTMFEASPLKYDSLSASIAAKGDDTMTIWRGDYGFARLLGMAPNNDPRQPAAREQQQGKFEKHVVAHMLQELKALERSGVGSSYISHTTDLSLLTGRFGTKEKSTTVNLNALPGFLASGVASAFGSAPTAPSTSTALAPASANTGVSIRNIFGVPGELFGVKRGRGQTLEVQSSRKAFEMQVPKSSLLPGMVSLSPNHAFANEQEVHGLERVSPWAIYHTYTAQELSEKLVIESPAVLDGAA